MSSQKERDRRKAERAAVYGRRRFEWDLRGKARDALSNKNIREVFRQLAYPITFNAFTQVEQLNGAPLTDRAMRLLRCEFADDFKMRPPIDVLEEVITSIASRHVVHPVRDYLESLEWDGVPRVDRWLIHYAGADDTPYVRAVSAKPLIAASRRVFQPGCKFDTLLILEGSQGCGKSSAVAALVPMPDWFSDHLPLDEDPKVVIEQTDGKWILEAAELRGSRGESAHVKALLSRSCDIARPAYGRYTQSFYRQWISIGTTNTRSGYLIDPTGARRFWPVPVNVFDVAGIRRDRDQLWAEARARDKAGESLELPRELWPVAAREQEARYDENEFYEDRLDPMLSGNLDGRVTLTSIGNALEIPPTQMHDQRISKAIRTFMMRRGWRKHPTNRGIEYHRIDKDVTGDDAEVGG